MSAQAKQSEHDLMAARTDFAYNVYLLPSVFLELQAMQFGAFPKA